MSARFGTECFSPPRIELDFWLTVDRGPPGARRPGVRVTAGFPNLSRTERAINLKITLPIALFETPSLSASITVDHPTQAVSIDTTAIAEAVRSAIGMDIDLVVNMPATEGNPRS